MILSTKKYIYEAPTDEYKLFKVLYHWQNTNKKMDITHTKKSPITFWDQILLYLLIKDRKEGETDNLKKNGAEKLQYQGNFGHGFKKWLIECLYGRNILPAFSRVPLTQHLFCYSGRESYFL